MNRIDFIKKLFVFACVYLWTTVACGFVSAQDFKTIQNGVEYAETTRGTESEPIKINLLRLDLRAVRLDVVHALDAAVGLETVSSMATRHGAMAAINAGFFRLGKSVFAGDAAGVLMIDGKLLSESYADRTAIIIKNLSNQTIVDFGQVQTKIELRLKDRRFEISGINRQRKEEDVIIYTPDFNRSTLTDSEGVEIVVEKNKVRAIIGGKGSNPIPSNGYVISAGKKRADEITNNLKIGNKASVLYALTSTASKLKLSDEDISGGVPQLVKNGAVEITWQQEKQSKSFVEERHPRTAVAKLKDGKLLMATIDGRQKESVGMNLYELAALLLELGATDAMNFDGGGSTTMFLGGKVVNKPSDKEGERAVGDAILVFPRKKQ